MVKFKGHLGIEQYMLLKRGLKVWVLAKASSGFVCNFHVYTGKRHDGAAEQNLGYCVGCSNLELGRERITMSFLTTFSLLLSLWKISWTWRTACILGKPRERTGKISQRN